MQHSGSIVGLLDALEQSVTAAGPVNFWLRDDDAVEPCESLDRLLALCEKYAVPLTLAVIPAYTGQALVQRLDTTQHVSVAVHGWSHTNHAQADEKKQELGDHRPMSDVLEELHRGFKTLARLHHSRFVPLLVPPWNRISPDIVEQLSGLGFTGLSTFGQETSAALVQINSQVDIIDWRGTRGGRNCDELMTEVIRHVHQGRSSIGILTHQLVHDEAAWQFLDKLFEATADHPGARWLPVSEWL